MQPPSSQDQSPPSGSRTSEKADTSRLCARSRASLSSATAILDKLQSSPNLTSATVPQAWQSIRDASDAFINSQAGWLAPGSRGLTYLTDKRMSSEYQDVYDKVSAARHIVRTLAGTAESLNGSGTNASQLDGWNNEEGGVSSLGDAIQRAEDWITTSTSLSRNI
ncbi:hypothetical protein P7C73_g641, partial [Tremellales sp. Uapishka_1]